MMPTDEVARLELMIEALRALEAMEPHVDVEQMTFGAGASLTDRLSIAVALSEVPLFRVVCWSTRIHDHLVGVRPGAIVQAENCDHRAGYFEWCRTVGNIYVIADDADVWGRRAEFCRKARGVRGLWCYSAGLEPLTPGAWSMLALAGDQRLPPNEWP